MKKEKHEFAIFTPEVARLLKLQAEYAVSDKELVNRMTTILRSALHDTIILFDQHYNVRCQVSAVAKKEITVRVLERHTHNFLSPHIIWFLPLLEREAFEDALTALTVMGIQDVYPIITDKSRTTWGNEKERDRAHRVMIAACEQSKQFCLPTIHETLRIDAVEAICFQKKITQKLFFDAQGNAACDVINLCKKEKVQVLACCVGPEGDLTQQEKACMEKAGFIFCALTPTILRASVAVQVAAGLMRSCL